VCVCVCSAVTCVCYLQALYGSVGKGQAICGGRVKQEMNRSEEDRDSDGKEW
jgi:hypothetical protein